MHGDHFLKCSRPPQVKNDRKVPLPETTEQYPFQKLVYNNELNAPTNDQEDNVHTRRLISNALGANLKTNLETI